MESFDIDLIITKLKHRHGDEIVSTSRRMDGIRCHPDYLLEVLSSLRYEFNFHILLDIVGIDHHNQEKYGGRFEVIYVLLSLENNQRISLFVAACEDEMSSASVIWKGAEWLEREVWDLMGISFGKKSESRLLLYSEFSGHPLRKDFDESAEQGLALVTQAREESDIERESVVLQERNNSSSWLGLGPSHTITNGKMRFMGQVELEDVIKTKFDIGYLHRGIEKYCESIPLANILDELDYMGQESFLSHRLIWCMAVENFFQCEIPDRAKALRMVFLEWGRILEHLFSLYSISFHVDMPVLADSILQQRNLIIKLLMSFSGERLKFPVGIYGGFAQDIDMKWISQCLDVVQTTFKQIAHFNKLTENSRTWIDRLQVAPISSSDAISLGITGPCLRATGINFDLRKVNNIYFYKDVDFEIPLGVSGTCFDIYLIRIEEIRQSLNIIFQLMENLPAGKVHLSDIKETQGATPESAEQVFSQIDGLQINSPYLALQSNDAYFGFEAPNGELGFYCSPGKGSLLNRFKVRSPNFVLAQGAQSMLSNCEIHDIPVCLSALNLCQGEIDR